MELLVLSFKKKLANFQTMTYVLSATKRMTAFMLSSLIMEGNMNFQNALSELFNGNSSTLELTRKHRLSSQQIVALEAVSKRVSDTLGMLSFPGCSMRMC